MSSCCHLTEIKKKKEEEEKTYKTFSSKSQGTKGKFIHHLNNQTFEFSKRLLPVGVILVGLVYIFWNILAPNITTKNYYSTKVSELFQGILYCDTVPE